MSPLIPKLWKLFVDGGAHMPAAIPSDCEIRRTYAGSLQKSAGAWTWHLWSQSDTEASRILMGRGSQYTASELVRAKSVSCLVQGMDASLFVEKP